MDSSSSDSDYSPPIKKNNKKRNFTDIAIADFSIPIKKLKLYNPNIQNNEIKNITNLIEIIDEYYINKQEFKSLRMLKPELIKINNLIGLNNIKEEVVKLVLYYIQHKNNNTFNNEMFHICLYGPPGMGKTTIAKLLGNIILKLNNWKLENFNIAKKSDLIGKYLGQTSHRTQDFINKCKNGILFIDEVYSIGGGHYKTKNKKKVDNYEEEDSDELYEIDSFGKECIDTIVHNLSENNNFVCIIAGYKDQTEKFFFNQNEGLSRRFPFKFEIKNYTQQEILEIFKYMCKKDELKLTINDIQLLNILSLINQELTFLEEDNYEKLLKQVETNYFPHITNIYLKDPLRKIILEKKSNEINNSTFLISGGDCVNILLNTKLNQAKRIFCLEDKKKIILSDIENGVNDCYSINHEKIIRKINILLKFKDNTEIKNIVKTSLYI